MAIQTPPAAIAAVALGALVISFAPIGLRLSELGPQATAVWRFVLALPLLIVLNVAKPSTTTPPRKTAFLLVLAGVAFGLDVAFWHAGLLRTSVVNATLFSNLTPVFAALAGWLFLHERIGWRFALGLSVGGAGALALALSRSAAGRADVSGDVLSAISAIWYAAYLVVLSLVRRTISVRQTMLWTSGAALLVALPAALLFGENLIPRTPQGWLVLIGLGVVVHVCGQGLIAYGVGRLPIAFSTVLLWIQPVAAALLSWATFGEAIAPLGLLGAALLLTGVLIVQTGRTRDSVSPPE